MQVYSAANQNQNQNAAAIVAQITSAAQALAAQSKLDQLETFKQDLRREKKRLLPDLEEQEQEQEQEQEDETGRPVSLRLDLGGFSAALVGVKLSVLNGAPVKEGSSLHSKGVGMIHRGSIIEVLEVVELLSVGLLRVKCSLGWISTKSTKDGTVIVSQCDNPDALEQFSPRQKHFPSSGGSDEGTSSHAEQVRNESHY